MQFNIVANLKLAVIIAALEAATTVTASVITLTSVSVSASAVATPAPRAVIEARFQGSAQFVTSWYDAGLTCYRFNFRGVDSNSFLHAFQNCGGITKNWQTWSENGHGVFVNNEVSGIIGARVISCGIYAVTGQDCHSISEIGC